MASIIAMAAMTLPLPLALLIAAPAGAQNMVWLEGHGTGSTGIDQPGVYGTKGIADPANHPGSREGATSWRDAAGNLWLFGGHGHATQFTWGTLNDLWKYDVASSHWTWMKGSNTIGQAPVDGTQGVPAEDNTPGGTTDAVSWTDNSGNLWLFRGDLWKYDVASGNWTWMKSSSQLGIYGTQGVAAADNTPGARQSSVSWTDSSGNLWLFGGYGSDASGSGYFNDLWKYDIITGNWTWMKGSPALGQYGTYGVQGVAAADNTPGGRFSPVSWRDNAGNFWLFGGLGWAVSSSAGQLSDLWKYDVVSGNWTWVKGSNQTSQPGIYGTQGVAAPGNMPGARCSSVSWTDSADNLWLFGGEGISSNPGGNFNDLWKYDTASGNWTWIKGSSNDSYQPGTYGVVGQASASNTPGARSASVSWTDSSGNLWLFGGYGVNGAQMEGYLDDLWKCDPATGHWMCVRGSGGLEQTGSYGTQGVAAAANTPGARSDSVSWTDITGNFWLFGGCGNVPRLKTGHFNDLWKYNVTAGWTWMKGSGEVDRPGVYGILGSPAAGNIPAGREGSVSWSDRAGNLWLFGGITRYPTEQFVTPPNTYNDIWKYDIALGNWTWMKGSSSANQPGTYGTQGTAAPGNTPGARSHATSWTDASGNLWVFGGLDSNFEIRNDLWKYDMASGNWTWMKGSNGVNQAGTYGTQGTSASANTPGARFDAVSWTDNSGNLWLFGGTNDAMWATAGVFNDLWKYDVASGNWTWMKGSNAGNQVGSYGTQGTPAPGNTPGARSRAVTWTDSAGNLWMFGGGGYSATSQGSLNDLWKYGVASGNWTWVKGSNGPDQDSTRGTQRVPAAENIPGGRSGATGQRGPANTLYLFGGVTAAGYLNELWAIALNGTVTSARDWDLFR